MRLNERWKRVLKLAWPLIVANSFWNLQLTIDRIFLGQYSTLALGAAMAVMGFYWVPMALLQQTAAYSITFTAQYNGSGQKEKIGPGVWQSIYLSLIGGVLFLAFIPISDEIFALMGHSENMQALESTYFVSLCFSALPTALVAGLSGFFTGMGRSQMVIWINGAGLLANVVLDYMLIFGNWGFPELGIAGAGYATSGANLIAAIVGGVLFFTAKNERLYKARSGWRWSWSLLLRFCRFGIPSGAHWALEGLAFTIFLIFIGHLPNGEVALVASSIAVTVMMLAILPPIGIGQAVSSLLGNHLGENRPEEAEKDAWTGVQIAATYIACVAATFILMPGLYLSLFENLENPAQWAEVATIVPFLLMFVSCFVLFDSLNMVLSFALKGAGDVRFTTLVALCIPWPLMVLPTYFVRSLSNGVYWAWGFASVFIITQAIVFLLRFRGGKWKKMRVVEMDT